MRLASINGKLWPKASINEPAEALEGPQQCKSTASNTHYHRAIRKLQPNPNPDPELQFINRKPFAMCTLYWWKYKCPYGRSWIMGRNARVNTGSPTYDDGPVRCNAFQNGRCPYGRPLPREAEPRTSQTMTCKQYYEEKGPGMTTSNCEYVVKSLQAPHAWMISTDFELDRAFHRAQGQ